MKNMLFLPVAAVLLLINTSRAASGDVRKAEILQDVSTVLQSEDRGLYAPNLLRRSKVGVVLPGELQTRQVIPPPPPPPNPSDKPSPPKPSDKPPPRETSYVSNLWRGDYRPPDVIRKDGGFDSWGKLLIEKRNPNYPDGMTPELFRGGCSLSNHALKTNRYSQYVPTTTSFTAAKDFVTQRQKPGYIYKIRASPNMVDVTASLGPGMGKWEKEREIAGVYDIPFKYIEGWYKVEFDPNIEDYTTTFAKNEDFAPTDDGPYSSHPELAGYNEGSTAASQLPWKQFNGIPVEELFNNYLLTSRYGGNLEEFKKLRPGYLGNLYCARKTRRAANTPIDSACLLKEAENKTPEPGAKTPAEKKKTNKGKGPGLFAGQGYNSLLEHGLIPDAVILRNEKKRDLTSAPATRNLSVEQYPTMMFNFTPPTANLTNLNVTEYFAPIDVAAFMTDLEILDQEHNATMTDTIHARGTDSEICSGTLKTDFHLIRDYGSYIKALDVSGAATIFAWGQKASISGNYLDHAEISNNGLTYIAVMEIEKQPLLPTGDFNIQNYVPATFNRDFGDKWIHGFKTGGKLIARLTFNSKGSLSETELKAHAEAALGFWGSSGKISAAVQNSIQEVGRHALLQTSLFYQGDLNSLRDMPKTVSADSAEASFMKVKEWTDQFLEDACNQNYEYRPYLVEYITAAGFPSQKILDYGIARRVSAKILQEIVRMSELVELIKKGGLGDHELEDIEWNVLEMIDLARKWVETIAKEPEVAIKSGRELVQTFQAKVFEGTTIVPLDKVQIATSTYRKTD